MDKSEPTIVVTVDDDPNNTLSEISSVEDTINLDNCISDEFPIIDIAIDNGIATCKIGNPRNGYTIVTSTKENKLNGEATIYTPDNIRIATFTYKKDEATGKCIFYYRSGKPLFQGYLKNGYRDGFGVEYNEEGGIAFSGFFKDGYQNPFITRSEEDSNLWYERDQFGNLISICNKDENGRNHGKCFFYDHGELSHISVWEHGKEIETTHVFNRDMLTIYKDGNVVFKGYYVMTSEFEFIQIPQRENPDHMSYLAHEKSETKIFSTDEDNSKYCCCLVVSAMLLIVEGIYAIVNAGKMEAGESFFLFFIVLMTAIVVLISCCGSCTSND